MINGEEHKAYPRPDPARPGEMAVPTDGPLTTADLEAAYDAAEQAAPAAAAPASDAATILMDFIVEAVAMAHGQAGNQVDWPKVADGVRGAVAALKNRPEAAAVVRAELAEPPPA
jgi:hypothetical protein